MMMVDSHAIENEQCELIKSLLSAHSVEQLLRPAHCAAHLQPAVVNAAAVVESGVLGVHRDVLVCVEKRSSRVW